jgi:hypothetical protein
MFINLRSLNDLEFVTRDALGRQLVFCSRVFIFLQLPLFVQAENESIGKICFLIRFEF